MGLRVSTTGPGVSALSGCGGLKRRSPRKNAEIVVQDAARGKIFAPYVHRASLSRKLREAILDRYPAVSSHAGHRSFLGYLLFTSFRGKDHRPVLKAEIVTRCYNARDLYEREYIRVYHLLRIFQRDVLDGFEWTEYKPGVGCREAYDTGVDNDLLQRVEEELHTRPDLIEDPVHWQTGNKINPKMQTRIRKELGEVAQDFRKTPSVSKRWARYLNARHPRLFSGLPEYKKAWEKAQSYEHREKQDGTLRHLRAMHVQPKPIYEFSRLSTRITASNSLQTIESELREIMTEEVWWEYDLSSAQLAIAAVEWGVPEVADFLAGGGSVWEHMVSHTGLGIEYKPVFKKAVYSTAYGAAKSTMLNRYMRGEAEKEGLEYRPGAEGSKILKHPFLAQIIPARDRKKTVIRRKGGAYDVFGRWLSVKYVERYKKNRSAAVRSILAQLNQAIEMSLLTPALQLAEEEEEEEKARKAWQIALYQYDGFSVKYHRSEKKHHRRIVDAVNAKAKRQGYPTRLEVK